MEIGSLTKLFIQEKHISRSQRETETFHAARGRLKLSALPSALLEGHVGLAFDVPEVYSMCSYGSFHPIHTEEIHFGCCHLYLDSISLSSVASSMLEYVHVEEKNLQTCLSPTS